MLCVYTWLYFVSTEVLHVRHVSVGIYDPSGEPCPKLFLTFNYSIKSHYEQE